MKEIGVRETAEEASVSSTTVSGVLNDRGYLSEEAKRKVFDTMKRLEYYPDELARALFKNKTYTVGLIFPTITNPFHAELIQDIEFELSSRGYKVLLYNSLNNLTKEKGYLTMLRKNQVDGIIVGTHNKDTADYNIPGLPIVAVDRSPGENTVTVSCDNYGGGELTTRLLINRGCQNILRVQGDSKIKLPANSRALAYKDVLGKFMLEPLVLEIPFVKEINEKNEIIKTYLETHPNIDGVLAGGDLLAPLAINGLRSSGKRVPKEIEMIGPDGAQQTLIYNPELSTIQQPIDQISKIAVKRLLNMTEGEKETDELSLPVKLIEKDTA